MLRNFYKLQRQCWLKSWGVLNNQNENLLLFENQNLQRSTSLELLPSTRHEREQGSSDFKNESNTKYGHDFEMDGLWCCSYQLHFWEAVGLGTAIVAGIRFTIEKDKYKKCEESRNTSRCVESSLLNQVHKATNLLLESEVVHSGLKALDLQGLSQIFFTNGYGLKSSVVPQHKTSNKEPVSNTVVKNKNEITAQAVDANKDAQQFTKERSINNSTHSFFHIFLPVYQSSTFLPSSLFEPISTVRVVTQSQLPAISLPTPQSCSLKLPFDQFHGLYQLLNRVKEELITDEKSNMASKLAKKGHYKRAIEIWNQILHNHPKHVKSLYNLAVCYENGLWLKKDIQKAKDLYKEASDMDHPRSSYRLAKICLHESKKSNAKDRSPLLGNYRDYLSKAALAGLTQAERELGIFLCKEGDLLRSASFLEKAASKNDELASHYLSLCKKAAEENGKTEKISSIHGNIQNILEQTRMSKPDASAESRYLHNKTESDEVFLNTWSSPGSVCHSLDFKPTNRIFFTQLYPNHHGSFVRTFTQPHC